MRRIESCYFGTGAGDQWPRMARVLAHTAAQQCPGWEIAVEPLPAPRVHPNRNPGHVANTAKLDHWSRLIEVAPDGDEVLLIDADTMILRPLDPIWDEPFDVAYTVRPDGYRHPLNGGVVFVRVSDAARMFLDLWRTENRRMFNDPAYHRSWKAKYAGINQPALGVLLEERRSHARLRALPCAEWNCEESAWPTFDPQVTRIVHLKSALRRGLFNLQPPTPQLKPLVRLWKTIEREAVAVVS